MERVPLAVPNPQEQQAITAALSDVDGLVSALDQLIAKKRALKLGAMQQLLTAKTRLPGYTAAWGTRPLHRLVTFISTANNPRKDLGNEGSVLYVHYGDVHGYPQPIMDCTTVPLPRIAGEKVSDVEHLQTGDLVIANASEDYAGIGKSVEVRIGASQEVVAGLHTLVCRGLSGQWADGFKGYLQFVPAFKNALIRAATGISVYGISKRHVAEVSLSLPGSAEQRAIVAVLRGFERNGDIFNSYVGDRWPSAVMINGSQAAC